MKREFALTVALLLGVAVPRPAAAQAATPLDLVTAAINAEGGVDALRGLKALTITAEIRHWEPEESYVENGPPVFTDHSMAAIAWDLENGSARTDWDREIQFPDVTHDLYSEIVTPTYGYAEVTGVGLVFASDKPDVPHKGVKAMSAIRVAAHIRELTRSSPTLLLKALDAPQTLSALPDQVLGGGLLGGAYSGTFPAVSLPAVALTVGPTTYTILFDRQTHFPAAIRTLDDDALLGDSNYDMILSDWRPVAGVQVARSLKYTLDNIIIEKRVYAQVTATAPIPAQTFAIPDQIKETIKPPSTGVVPYQWVLRRLNFNRFPDSDAINFMPGGGLKLVELAPDVQQVQGGSHNSLIVAMKDYLVVFDAPINEWQSHFTIAAAKARYPGKPIKYLVLTHHHNDHTGGARTYVAEGAAVIVPAPDKSFFARVFTAPHKLVPDDLQKHPRPAAIIEVGERMTLKDGAGGEIRLYNVTNPHVQGMLIGYVAHDSLLWDTDMYSPGLNGKPTPGSVNLYTVLAQLGLKPDHIAGGHGGAGSFAEFEASVGK